MIRQTLFAINERGKLGIIDEDLLRRRISHHLKELIGEDTKSEERFDLYGDFRHIESLSLDFENLTEITNLWQFPSLRKLRLCLNNIRRISGLDRLSLLTELDLSFNEIEKLENLDGLKNLETLNLSHNNIKEVENLDGLDRLAILRVNHNLIENMLSVKRLATLKTLRALNLESNPFDVHNYESFVIAHLQGLEYLDGKLITSERRKSAQEEHCKTAEGHILGEVHDSDQLQLVEKEIFQDVGRMKDLIFENDFEGSYLLTFEHTINCSNLFLDKIGQFIEEIGQQSIKEHFCRKERIQLFLSDVFIVLETVKSGFKRAYERFRIAKRELLHYAHTAGDDIESDKFMELFQCPQLNLEENLMMCEEKALNEIEDFGGHLKIDMKVLVDEFLEKFAQNVSHCKTLNANYTSQMIDLLIEYFNANYNALHSQDETCQRIMSDKHSIKSTMEQSNEEHIKVMDKIENSVVAEVQKCVEEQLKQLMDDQMEKSRRRLAEIVRVSEYEHKAIETIRCRVL